MAKKIEVRIYYTDGEVVRDIFENFTECLDYLQKEVVEKKEFVDDVEIHAAN